MRRGEIDVDFICSKCQQKSVIPRIDGIADEVGEQQLLTPRESEVPDVSLDNPDRVIEHHEVIDDKIVDDLPLDGHIITEVGVTFEKVSNGTKRGGVKLVSSDGFAYTKKRECKDYVYWTCSKRSKYFRCNAWVKEYDTLYVRCLTGHQHPPDMRLKATTIVSSKVKESIRDGVFKSTKSIVDEVMRTYDCANHKLPNTVNIERYANRYRQSLRLDGNC